MAKIDRLKELLAKVKAGDVRRDRDKAAVIEDTNGERIALTDPRAQAALERRIALEEGGDGA